MFLSLNTNLNALTMQRSLFSSTSRLGDAMHRLSSGVRINSASDDAANFVLSKNLESKSSGLSVANNNIKTALGKLYTLDGYFKGITDSLHRSRDLAVQAANAPYSEQELASLNENASEMQNEVSQAQENANSEVYIQSGTSGKLMEDITPLLETEAIANGYDENHIIRTAADFQTKVNADKSGDFILVADLDMSELGTLNDSVVTDDSGNFSGTFDGNGYVVRNLTINTGSDTGNYIGLFSYTSGGEIKNLGVESIDINSPNKVRVGGITGYSSNTSITNCYVTGSVKANGMTGGLVGWARSSTNVENCYSDVTVYGTGMSVGGIVGENYTSTIKNSYSNGSTTGTNWMTGGVAGNNTTNATIEGCYSTGDVNGGSTYTGGITGRNYDGSSIDNCYSTSNVIGGNSTGGIAGRTQLNNSTVTNSYFTGTLSGASGTGGISGTIYSGGIVDNTNYWDIETSGYSSANGDAQGLTTSAIEAIIALGVWDEVGTIVNADSGSDSFSVQIGLDAQDDSTYDLGDLSIDLELSINLTTTGGARSSIDSIDTALSYMLEKRAKLGAGINSLESISMLNSQRQERLESTNSKIRDTDIASESASMIRQQILQQSTVGLMQQAQRMNSEILLSLMNL